MPDDPTVPQDEAKVADIIARANLQNLIKRVKAGKPLTAAQLDLIAGKTSKQEARKVENEQKGLAIKRWCEFWRIRPKSAYQLNSNEVDLDSTEAVVKWFFALSSRSQGMVAKEFRDRIHEERAKLAGDKPAIKTPADEGDPDVADFEASYHPSEEDDAKGNLADIRREVAFASFRMKRARARRDSSAEADAAKLFRNFSDLLHDCELRALRLGRDLGESFSADDVRRLGRAVAYWLLASADTTVGQIASGLASAQAVGPLDRAAVRRVVEPVILADRMLAPMVRAVGINAGVALPGVFVDAMRAGAEATLEDGATEFDRLYSQPVPEPGAGSPPVSENEPR